MHVAPRAVNRSLLLELAGDNSPEGREDEREYEDGRDHLAQATSAAEIATWPRTEHCAQPGVVVALRPSLWRVPKMFHVYREVTPNLT